MTKELIIKELTKTGNLKNTYKKVFNKTAEELYIIYHNYKNINCICGENLNFLGFTKGYSKYCKRECSNKNKWTEESKTSGVQKRKEYYDKNPEKLAEKHKKISCTNKKVWASGTELRESQKLKTIETFSTGKPLYLIGNISNLEMLPAIDNCSKQRNSSVTIEEILEGLIC